MTCGDNVLYQQRQRSLKQKILRQLKQIKQMKMDFPITIHCKVSKPTIFSQLYSAFLKKLLHYFAFSLLFFSFYEVYILHHLVHRKTSLFLLEYSYYNHYVVPRIACLFQHEWFFFIYLFFFYANHYVLLEST